MDRLIPCQTIHVSTDVARRIGEQLRPERYTGQTATIEVYRDGDRLIFQGTTVLVDRELPPESMRLPDGTIITV